MKTKMKKKEKLHRVELEKQKLAIKTEKKQTNKKTHTHTHKTYSSPDGEHCYIDRHRESYEDDGRPERLHENTFSALRLLPKTKVVKKSRKIINSAADKNNIVAYASRYE